MKISDMNLSEIGKKLTQEDLSELESKLNIILSSDYKVFLLQNNGGTPDKMIGLDFIEIDPNTNKSFDQGTDVQYFYDIDLVITAYGNLIAEELIPEKYISFACDSCGNAILLCSDASENNGKVYFANHGLYNQTTGAWVITEIASSFDEFIGKLEIEI